ncbi:uncharacterized protein PAC_02381 [Phialocephala subalpina]|uniref:Uncharacterized protein n=1 Tax=Phialocephala subalpina TaxID=576137 RepID=A0A1L7WI98_9HELO|nr:uncharacterized protein PAC_02381 [Phialocephala subalpina]
MPPSTSATMAFWQSATQCMDHVPSQPATSRPSSHTRSTSAVFCLNWRLHRSREITPSRSTSGYITAASRPGDHPRCSSQHRGTGWSLGVSKTTDAGPHPSSPNSTGP